MNPVTGNRRLSVRRLLDGLGLPGVVAIGLATAAGAFHASVVAPLGDSIDETRERVALLERQGSPADAAARDAALGADEQLAEFHRAFPAQSSLTDSLEKIFAAARDQGIVLAQGDYRLGDESVSGVRRFLVQLPVKSDYARIRAFLGRLAAEVPTAAIEHIQLERQRIGDTQLEASIRLAVYVGPAP